jgi:UDP-N-acetylglucosamine 2-epimerase
MILSVVGARPQFVKAAVLSRALCNAGIEEKIIHTGQHYDEKMSDVFWEELGLPKYAINLESGSGSHGVQTARMIEKMELYILSLNPEPKALLLYGDTNSTLAGSVVASKIHLPIIHVEAGLRSFNRSMPEEINRIVTDHLSSLLFCSSEASVTQLAKEGITHGVFNTGDVMFDAIQIFSEEAAGKISLDQILPFSERPFSLLTLHRPATTEDERVVPGLLSVLKEISMPFIWPVHPRLRSKIAQLNIPDNVYPTEPLSYFEMLIVLKNCHKVLTDSGGLQKEAYWLKKPCITLRPETEWLETVHNGWNTVVDFDYGKIKQAFARPVLPETWFSVYGDGNAAKIMAGHIREFINQ